MSQAICLRIYMRVFFGKGTLVENNLYESDAASHQKEDMLNEDWSEFIPCDWNQLLGSKVSHIESGDPARTKDYDYSARARRKGETFRYRYEVNGKWFSNILNVVNWNVIQKAVKDLSFEQITYYVQTVERRKF